MTETTHMTPPTMEFRETAKRFAWLCVILAVISLITTVANETFGPFGQDARIAAEKTAAPTDLVARR
jgi:hypothetical protein